MRAAIIGRATGGVLAGTLALLAATGASGEVVPPAVTITQVSPAIVGAADSSVNVTWRAGVNGAYQVRAKANSCGTGTLAASGTYAGAPDETVTTPVPASLFTEGQNAVRVCVSGNTADSEPVRKDTAIPTSTANGLAAESGRTMTVGYTASDAGTGLQVIELWVKAPGDATFAPSGSRVFTSPASGTQSGSFTFVASVDGVHEFYTRARDGARNYESAPAAADVTTTVNANQAPIVASSATRVSVNEGSTAAMSGTFSDADGDGVTLSASSGEIAQTGTASGTWTWSFRTLDGPDDSRTVTITADDGDHLTTTAFALVVRNTPPLVVIRGPTTANEGDTKPYTYALSDRGADTVALSPTFPACGIGGVVVPGSHVPDIASGGFECSFSDGPAIPAVRVTAVDSDGAAGTSSRVVSVANLSPSATLTGGPGDEGEPTTITFTNEHDPSAADVDTGLRYAVRCNGTAFPGAPTYAEASATSQADCVFEDEGLFTVRGAVVDKDGGYTEYTTEVVIANVPPTPQISGAPATSPEGAPIALAGSVTDIDPDPHTLAWVVTKDGSPYAGGSGPAFAFTPDDDGTFVVVLTASDDGGGVGSDSATIVVTNVGPTLTFTSGDSSIPEGSSGSEPHVYGFSISDPGADHVAEVTADCGADGTRVDLAFDDSGGTLTCTFSASALADGPRTLVVAARASDDGGTSGPAVSRSVDVTNVAPTVTPLLPAPFSVVRLFRAANASASFADPGPDAPYSAWIEWGDGSMTNTTIAGNIFSGTHAYTTSGNYTVRFFVRDKDGGVGTAAVPIVVSP